MTYQTFPGIKGDSDSSAKLKSLCLPDLKGKKVLDIGCNEGFFCIEAKKMGASRVVGIDNNINFIESAREKARELNLEIEFLHQSWDALPEEKFDVVLFLSTLHYVKDKKKFLDSIADILLPDGFLVLECGAVADRGGELIEVKRGRDTVYHPTYKYLINSLLSGFSIRHIGNSIIQAGDPVPRFVLFCYKYKPIVIMAIGESKDGKSTLAREIKNWGANVMEIDQIIKEISVGNKNDGLSLFIKDNYHSLKIDVCLKKLVEDGLGGELASEILKRVARSRLLVLEGYALSFQSIYEPLIENFKKRDYVVWEVRRRK